MPTLPALVLDGATGYQSTVGELITRCGPGFQPKTVGRARQLADTGAYMNCDFEQPAG
ncbi:hypothetical protein [Streptomyces sp. NPDC048155]|uniref:hypothetical protein n=1 Tax=unclassified Streptomyces TaxID=2593676 RepID=UPI00340B0FF6